MRRLLFALLASGSVCAAQAADELALMQRGEEMVMGKVNAQGVYPIERPTRTLSSMLSKSGGVSIEPEVAVVTVKRGGSSGKVWLRDLYSNNRNDIALRPGDVILSVAGKPTDNVSQLLTAVAGLQPGKAASFELHRGDRQLELSVVPGTRPRMQQRR